MLSTLCDKELPTYKEVNQVEDVMYDVVTEHFGPDQASDAEGLRIEDALVSVDGPGGFVGLSRVPT